MMNNFLGCSDFGIVVFVVLKEVRKEQQSTDPEPKESRMLV